MSRKWSPTRGWEPLTEEQLASLAIARERFAETCTWAHYIGHMSPERIAQQRAYDRERGRKYYQEHKESTSQYSKDWCDKLNTNSNCAKNMQVSCVVVATQ